jgi:hypothetical protein
MHRNLSKYPLTYILHVEWVTKDSGTAIEWKTITSGNTVFHQVLPTTPSAIFADVAEDSIAYYAISSVSTS